MNSKLFVVSHNKKKNDEIPCIKLQGDWIRSEGFAIGDEIIVEIEQGNIIIKNLKKEINLINEKEFKQALQISRNP